MPFASSSFGQLRYIPEVTAGTIPATGNAVNLRMTQPTLKAAISTVKSAEIRPDRLSTGQARTDLAVDGGFNFELSGKEYDPFFEAILGSNFTHYGTAGFGSVFSATTAALLVTAAVAPTTTSAFANITAGSWFKLVPPAVSSAAIKDYFADKWFKAASTTTTTIVLDASTPIAAPGIVTAVAGYSVSQSVLANGPLVKSFAMEYAMTDVAQVMTYTGLQANTLDLDIQVGAIVTGSFGFMGRGHTIQAGSLLPGTAVVSQTLEVMNAVNDVGVIYEAGTNLLSATSFIKGLKLSVSNNLRGQKAIGVFGNAGVGYGELALSGSMEVYFQDATYYNKWLNGTTTSLAIGLADAAGNGYLLEMDKVLFNDGGLNPGGNGTDVMLTLPFSAFYNAATGRGIRVTRAVAA